MVLHGFSCEYVFLFKVFQKYCLLILVFFVQQRCALQLKILESIGYPAQGCPAQFIHLWAIHFLAYGLSSPVLLINPWAEVKNMWAL